jgi:hypothetical protein
MSTANPSGLGWADVKRADGDPRPPGPLVVSIAFGLLLGWVALTLLLDLPGAVVAVGVLVIATWRLTVPAALALGVTAFLFIDGFVQNAQGQLSWNGVPDLVLVLACLTLPAMSAELGSRSSATGSAAAQRRRCVAWRAPTWQGEGT